MRQRGVLLHQSLRGVGLVSEGRLRVNGTRVWPQAIFFDVGETLVYTRHLDENLLAEVSRDGRSELPNDAIEGLTAYIDACVIARTNEFRPFTFPPAASQQFWLETYHGFFSRFLSDPAANDLAHAVRALLSSPAGYALFDDTTPVLMRLQTDGYRLGIISNWEAWLPELLSATGITRFFDHVIISGECRIEKPNPGIFTLALETSGYLPNEVVYVGDRPSHDVEPALGVGITPILLDRTDRHLDSQASARINSLSELPIILEQLALCFARPRG